MVLALSPDSRFAHAAWGASLGGIRMPILADFYPHGAVAQSYGSLLPDGKADRATVIVDRGGVVRYAQSAGVDGRRDIAALLAVATDIARSGGFQPVVAPAAQAIAPGDKIGVLFASHDCGHCTSVKRAATNLKVLDRLLVRYVEDDANAARDLMRVANGSAGTPVLLLGDGQVLRGAGAIIGYLTTRFGAAS